MGSGSLTRQREPGHRRLQTNLGPWFQRTHAYDQANRLANISGAVTASYGYNGDGLRTSKTTPAGEFAFTWDLGAPLPMALSDGHLDFVYGPDGAPLSHVDGGGEVTFYGHDQLGSTRLLTDGDGTVTGTYRYEPYGIQLEHTGSEATPLGYAGQYTDTETGYQYLRARYYDPMTAQFLTRDPINALTREAYGYTGGNPLNYTDPTGMIPGLGAFNELFSPGRYIDAVGGALRDTARAVGCALEWAGNRLSDLHDWAVDNRGLLQGLAAISALGVCLLLAGPLCTVAIAGGIGLSVWASMHDNSVLGPGRADWGGFGLDVGLIAATSAAGGGTAAAATKRIIDPFDRHWARIGIQLVEENISFLTRCARGRC